MAKEAFTFPAGAANPKPLIPRLWPRTVSLPLALPGSIGLLLMCLLTSVRCGRKAAAGRTDGRQMHAIKAGGGQGKEGGRAAQASPVGREKEARSFPECPIKAMMLFHS